MFRASERSKEDVPLLETRIRLLREAGEILIRVSYSAKASATASMELNCCLDSPMQDYQGSFHNILKSCSQPANTKGQTYTVDALSLVQKVVDTFPMFRDEATHPKADKVYLWKRPQILVAELWAAFESVKHSAADFPTITGISNLTMFAD